MDIFLNKNYILFYLIYIIDNYKFNNIMLPINTVMFMLSYIIQSSHHHHG
jgi:hypothetical protein